MSGKEFAMRTHASWKGHLKISLASVPVQAYTASAGKASSEIALHQLHKSCKSRIQYKKFCPIHGEVTSAEIVSGFEYAKGQYAILDKDEMAALGEDLEKSLTIDAFVSPGAIDPLYSAGQTYYLVPDGAAGEKPYALIRHSLEDEDLHGIGEVVISKKQHLVRLRSADKLLLLDFLHYEGELRGPDKFADEVANPHLSATDLKLTKSLIEQLTDLDFDISQYSDDYMERMKELIKTKTKGKKIPVPAAEEEEPDVINFMDALKKSVKLGKTPREEPETHRAKSKSHSNGRAPVKRRRHTKTG
jgi:DNA end-binding protein Ku